ncbi:DMT family transporter [Novosphingobium mangrovi (ex Huang et al. 2023)]|uniref:DMT family transporter n=1 Tax=Novosphingobium mangrovi (ex Huang et al. 2023) TaxID=2976432 RepID=A0ABT2I557_9SPHN|nr:DMT family transporter [Novosphingobium mangrovi (ex Huang et al. 2023)]MCT2399934.1 DMT family transporter [Novosphingobium mangrovi (ex Huang et al. 2023)]
MSRALDTALAAMAPAVWGSTFLVTTQFLPQGYPLTAAMLRALPAGLLLLAITRRLPSPGWWLKIFVLGAVNFTLFWWLLFVAAYRLPGGVAATVGAIQPLIVLFLAKVLLDQRITPMAVAAGFGGLAGVSLLVLTPQASFDPWGIAAAAGGAVSMALGGVLTRRWQPPVPALTFAAWQLTAGGVLLVPVAMLAEPALPPLSTANLLGFAYLCLIGAALTYILWFRGIARLGPAALAPLGFLSPATAVLLGWVVLGERLDAVQTAGFLLVVLSVWIGQRAQRRAAEPEPNAGNALTRLVPALPVRSVAGRLR